MATKDYTRAYAVKEVMKEYPGMTVMQADELINTTFYGKVIELRVAGRLLWRAILEALHIKK